MTPPAGSNKGRKKLPVNTAPIGTVCVPVQIPADSEWIGMFLGAIHSLTLQSRYYRDPAHTAQVIAARWREVYAQVENAIFNSEGCGGSPLPQTLVRQNSVNRCTLEYSLDDGSTWLPFANLRLCKPSIVTTSGGELLWYDEQLAAWERWLDNGYAPPSKYPEFTNRQPVAGDTDDIKRCNASFGAAVALQALYRDTWNKLINETPQTAVRWAIEVARTFSELLGAHWLWEYALESYQDWLLASDDFTVDGYPDSVIEDVQNILYCRSTVDEGGIVSFDFNAVVADFGHLLGSPFPGLNFLLQVWLREDGLNYAGTVDYGAGDCSGAECLECLDYATDFNGGLVAPWFIDASFPAALWNTGGRGQWIGNSGRSNTPCLMGTSNGTYREIDLIIDLGLECTVTRVSSWWITNAFSVDVRFAFFNAAQEEVVPRANMGTAGLAWVEKVWTGSVANVRYVALMGQGSGSVVLQDDARVDTA